MAVVTWDDFKNELARRRHAGRPVEFWWRDDDAGQVSAEVDKLLRLSSDRRIPLSLAVVPAEAQPELFPLLHERVSVLQHGTDHRNRAKVGQKKTEYPDAEPAEQALARIADGMEGLRRLSGRRFVPVLAPPWNRLRKDLVKKLPALGICGISGYGPRESAEPAPGLRQVNTHVDIVAWRQGKRFIGEKECLELALRHLDHDEPVGWLTHHAVHDAAAWDFLARLFSNGDVRWLSAAEAFSYTAPAPHG